MLVPRSPLVAAVLTAVLGAQHDGVTPITKPGAAIDFAHDVRPILAQHCYRCHGPDDSKRKGDLRLDRRADAFAARDNGAAFVAGDPDGSEALVRVLSTDPDDRMPPPEAGDALKPAQIEVLRQWLAAGAPWSEHWSFVPPTRPNPPTTRDSTWVKNDIDKFVLARLEQEGLQPSSEATRESWLRRVSFDLIGLPPTIAELDAFLKDTAADAFEKVVDRLLADPRYGERQASEWLDAARYADSSGYQRDTGRQAWKWRDWVIDAFNQNKPFDQFTIEQLAGDLLPNATLAQKIATGFNRNHPVNTEAGEELDEYRSAYVIDRVHTTATTFLGLSVGCAQCHDHKYDPISQREFYGFYDFFNHVKEKDNGFGRNPKPAIPAPGPDDIPRLADLEKRMKTLEKRLDRVDPLADEAQAEWQQATLQRVGADANWTTLVPTELMAKHGSRLQRLDDGSILATGPTPARDTYELVFAPGKRTIQALQLEVLPDPSLPHGASGRADDGRFILSGLEVRLQSVSDSSDPPRVVWALSQADLNQERDEEEHYLTAIEPGSFASSIVVGDGPSGGGFRGGGGWSVAGDARKEPRQAMLIPIEPLVTNDTSILRVTLTHSSSNKFKSLIGRFRIVSTDDARVRSWLLPLQPSLWRSLGPFPAATVDAAYATEFAPEKDLEAAAWKKKYDQPIVAAPKSDQPAEGKPGAGKVGADKASEGKSAGKVNQNAGDNGAPPSQPPDVDRAGTKPAAPTPPSEKPANDDEPQSSDGAAKQPSANAGKAAKATKQAPAAKDGEPTKPVAETKEPNLDAPAAKPAAADQKPAPESDDGDGKDEPPAKPKPRRLEWQEQRDWRDGQSARLPVEGQASAAYVSRKIKVETARTMMLEFDGGTAAKVWLNGNLVGEYAPPPEPKEAPKVESPPQEFDEEAFFAMRMGRREPDGRKLRLGLRAGDNFLVVKLVGKGQTPRQGRPGAGGDKPPAAEMAGDGDDDKPFAFAMQGRSGGGLSFTCTMKAEGDDLLDFETLVALRTQAATPKAAMAEVTPTPASASVSASGPMLAREGAPKSAASDDEDTKPKTPAERRAKTIRRWFRTHIDIAGRALFEELERVKAEKERIENKLPSALVMEELKKPRETRLFVRGDYRKRGDVVTAMTPAVLPPMAADLPKNRLGLAKWLVGKDHPLTARVTVNRYWQQFFGLGLVRTADDFGIRGTPPSHAELLDWMATEFVASGWNVKQTHRLIVLSATYRQANTATPAAWAADPDNVLLARGPRQRLAAEMVRDQALATAGTLVQKIGGESVKPFQPPGLWKSMLGSGDWKADTGDKALRRGLYVYWKRGVPYPSFTIFDAAKRETCTVTRTKTTTPLQALVTLNDPVLVQAGKDLGLRMHKEGGKDDEARLQFGFRLVTSRRADDKELAVLKTLLAEQKRHYEANLEAAKAVLGIADKKPAGKGARRAGSKPDGKAEGKSAATPTDQPQAVEPAGTGKPAGAEVAGAGKPPAADAASPSAPLAATVAGAGTGAGTAAAEPAKKPQKQGEPELPPAEAAAWAQVGCTLLNLEAAIRRG